MSSESEYIDTWCRVFTTMNDIIGLQYLFLNENGKAASVDCYFSSFKKYDEEKPDFGSWHFDSDKVLLKINSGDLTLTANLILEEACLTCHYEFGITTFSRASTPVSRLMKKLIQSVPMNPEIREYFSESEDH